MSYDCLLGLVVRFLFGFVCLVFAFVCLGVTSVWCLVTLVYDCFRLDFAGVLRIS